MMKLTKYFYNAVSHFPAMQLKNKSRFVQTSTYNTVIKRDYI